MQGVIEQMPVTLELSPLEAIAGETLTPEAQAEADRDFAAIVEAIDKVPAEVKEAANDDNDPYKIGGPADSANGFSKA